MTNTVIEMVSYRLKETASKQQLITTHDQVNAFLLQQEGFLYRSLSEDGNGMLFDVVYWSDMTREKRAGERFMSDPAGKALVNLCDESSITMRHMPLLTEKAKSCSDAV